jgi:5-methylcytosine-specific restriction protein A
MRHITDPNAVEKALDEFDRIGRKEFLRRYRFGKARAYFIVRDGKQYDSKAVLGAAHKYQYGQALPHEDFSGGDAGAARELRGLGFTVVGPEGRSREIDSQMFILTWNSLKWDWDASGRGQAIAATAQGLQVPGRWATGVRTGGIVPGDRAFLLQQGPRRGMVASGLFTSEVFQEPHWDGVPGKVANYAYVSWDKVLPDEQMLSVEEIKAHVPGLNWDRIQGSGVLLPEPGASRLGELWGTDEAFTSPEEECAETHSEGAVTRVTVNRYERSPRARAKCLAHYGAVCVVCDLSFGQRYGSIGEGFIHVHHLKEVSSIGQEYVVDPIEDLRPVCPNCHAMLHTRTPPFTPDELRDLLRT